MPPVKYVSQIMRVEKKLHLFTVRNQAGTLLRIRAIIVDHGPERAGPNRWETQYTDINLNRVIHREHSVIIPTEDRVLSAFSTFLTRQANV